MNETLELGIIMDPIANIKPYKDTSFALLLKAQSYGWNIHYLEQQDLFLKYGIPWGRTRSIEVFDQSKEWYNLGHVTEQPLDQFDMLLMRKDPPVDLEYIYTTNMLDHVEQNGTLVVNRPQSLRDANEKLFATWFPQCMAPTLVSSIESQLKAFTQEQGTVVFKPLDSMGGENIFKSQINDPNLNVIIDMLTLHGKRPIMVQRYIPEIIDEGDKRIILINGEPIPYALARIPEDGQFRGNLAAGGTGIGVKLTERDRWICAQIGPTLREKGLYLVGIDVIGDYLTEINVTSPTCVRELEAQFKIDISGKILDTLAELVQN
jgi:glutathione synthase